MPDIASILDDCFEELSREYEIEKVDYVPKKGKKEIVSVPVWRIVRPAEVNGKVISVEVFIAFPHGFPFEMPYVIIPDEKFRYLPHISFDESKLCLYEDGITYDDNNILGIIRDNIKRARVWIEKFANRDNSDEYATEIKSYWFQDYDSEEEVDECATLFGDVPEKTCELKGLAYSKVSLDDDSSFIQTVFYKDESNNGIQFLKKKHKVIDFSALFISSIAIPAQPPYSVTGEELISWVLKCDDRQALKTFINRYGKGHILFSIGLEHTLGGVFIEKLNTKRNGFRRGQLTPFMVLTRFENKTRHLQRLIVSTYNEKRIAERTVGFIMPKRNIVIAGLGSIGSNLCYYLNGYNNAQFALIDRERLTIDNIGRHLWGYEYLNQRKTLAIAHYLQSFRPDRKVTPIQKHLQDISANAFNEANALFVCTGDIMSERWLLSQMSQGAINLPAFILWLEPYGVSGIMCYLNPNNKESIELALARANDNFMDYCLIERSEYTNDGKLIKRDAGCNGQYALYSANDVTFFLSAMFPYIDQLLSAPLDSKVYRWIGNLETAIERDILLVQDANGLTKHTIQELPL